MDVEGVPVIDGFELGAGVHGAVTAPAALPAWDQHLRDGAAHFPRVSFAVLLVLRNFARPVETRSTT